MVSFVGLVLALLAWYLFGSPVLFYFRYKVQSHPTIENCDPSELPEAVRENFNERFFEFSSLQFRHCGTFTMPQAIKNFKSLFAVYENEQHNITAVTSAIFWQSNNVWRLKQQFVEIGTRFSDGADVSTTNISDILMYPPSPGCVRTQHPDLEAMTDLFNAHVSMVEHHRRSRSSVSELKTKHGDEVLGFYSESVYKELSRAEKLGYLKLKTSQLEKSEPVERIQSDNPYSAPAPDLIDQGSVFVPTFIGAFKMMWQILWPMKPILVRLRLARDRKLLAETGYQWP